MIMLVVLPMDPWIAFLNCDKILYMEAFLMTNLWRCPDVVPLMCLLPCCALCFFNIIVRRAWVINLKLIIFLKNPSFNKQLEQLFVLNYAVSFNADDKM